MRRRLVVPLALASLLGLPVGAPAQWPVFGGDASRSGYTADDAGEVPIVAEWSTVDEGVRTPVVVTGGGGPSIQRVAYGTADGRLHLQSLATGAPVGDQAGIPIESSNVTNDPDKFGRGAGAIGFADTSTEDRPGLLLVVHNEDTHSPAVTPHIAITRVDPATGTVIAPDIVVSSSRGCTTNSSPLITPPDPAGGRVLYFTMTGTCTGGTSLVRMPIPPDASRADAEFRPAFAPVAGLVETAAPSLVVLRDPQGAPRYHVAVGRAGSVAFYDAGDPLSDQTPPPEVAPAVVATLDTATEEAQTSSAAAGADGIPAGGAGSRADQPPALYVPVRAGSATRVYRFVQDGPARQLRASHVTPPLPHSGAPAPALAVGQRLGPGGATGPGVLVVPSAGNLTLLRAGDLGVVWQISPNEPLAPGHGFARNVAAVSGRYAYIQRDGGAEVAPAHLALRLDEPALLSGPDFAPAAGNAAGSSWGQPAVARGWIVYGSAAGAFAYRDRDVTQPSVSLTAPAAGARLSGMVAVAATAADDRGIGSVQFRLVLPDGDTRNLGSVAEPDAGSPFAGGGRYSLSFPTVSVPNGEYMLEAFAVDPSGNRSTSERRPVRIANRGSRLPAGACVRDVLGTPAADRIAGSSRGDRMVGGAGSDRLSGRGGHDCLLGQDGRDSLSGGSGSDLLDGGAGSDGLRGGSGVDRLSGGAGNDRLHGGSGRNRLSGGSGADRIWALNRSQDSISCGRGRDRVTADRRDRVSRNCERVRRVGRRR